MRKVEIISTIWGIINNYGPFSTYEVEADYSPCVNSMGSFVALAEYFELDEVEISVYEPESFSSDSIQDYKVTYNDLTVPVLLDILKMARTWKQIKLDEDGE